MCQNAAERPGLRAHARRTSILEESVTTQRLSTEDGSSIDPSLHPPFHPIHPPFTNQPSCPQRPITPHGVRAFAESPKADVCVHVFVRCCPTGNTPPNNTTDEPGDVAAARWRWSRGRETETVFAALETALPWTHAEPIQWPAGAPVGEGRPCAADAIRSTPWHTCRQSTNK